MKTKRFVWILVFLVCLAACAGKPKDADPSPAVSTVSVPTESAKPAGFTDEELCDMARKYYERHHDFTPPVVVVDHTDGDTVTIHLFEDLEDHIATLDWYTVDRITGKGSGMLEGEIDLND